MKLMKRLTVLIILLIILFAATATWWAHGLLAVNKSSKTNTTFVVHQGEGLRSISNRLATDHLVNDSIVFFLLTKALSLDSKIEAGDFTLSQSMSAAQIAKELTHGAKDVWVTIPEGKRSEEVATLLQPKLSNYNSSWNASLDANEGYLFPDTYLFPKNASVNEIIKIMRDNFDQKYASVSSTNTSGLSEKDVITLASILEREGKTAQNKAMIASVLINRIKLGMPLQVDATVQYALGYQPDEHSWWKNDSNITAADLTLNSPYNTYVATGLPPGPICNPGLTSIKAALNPAQTDYLYYISDKNGNYHFAKTADEHNANIQKYGL